MTIPKNIVKATLDAYIVFALVLSTQAFLSLFVDPNEVTAWSEGSLVLKAPWFLVYTVSLLRIVPRRHQVAQLLRANRLFVFLVLLASISLLWSSDPVGTMHAAGILVLSALFAIDLSIHYSIQRQLQLICYALVLVVVLSVITELFFPKLVPVGIDFLEVNGWHGVFGSKNEFGRIVSLAVVACLASARRTTWVAGLTVTIGVVLALLSKSASAVGYTALMVLVFMMWPILKWRPKPRRTAIVMVAILAALTITYISQNLGEVTSRMGKDQHLSGRVDLWRLSLADIAQKPVLGYGYQAFWKADSQPARRIREEVHWDGAPHSHNGYIDLTLGIGVTGLIGYLLLNFILVKRAYIFFMSGTESYRRWPLSYLTFMLMYQFTESTMVSGNTIFWLLLCSLTFSLAEVSADERVGSLVVFTRGSEDRVPLAL